MRILLKYPTRQRPQIFLQRLREWVAGAADMANIIVLVSYDLDDVTMRGDVIEQALKVHPNVRLIGGHNVSKIAACNADINTVSQPWDIVLLMSDDMVLRRHHWDARVRQDMVENFPDTDGALWYHDGTKQRDICTLACMGRKFYERFGYIYYPKYRSFWCDNEGTDVARSLGKLIFFDHVLASHEHPAWNGGMKKDALYARNNVHWAHDRDLYYARKAQGFPK